MKTRITTLVSILALVLVALGAAQSNPKAATESDTSQQVARANTPRPVANAQAVRGEASNNASHPSKRIISGDEAYKANCTRCHSEVPQRNVRSINTTVRHMRVRANLTMDEAKAILEYLTQ